MAFVGGIVGLKSQGRSAAGCGRRTATSMVMTTAVAGNEGKELEKAVQGLNGEDFGIATGRPNKISVVKFYAPWCRACAKVSPMLEEKVPEFPEMDFFEMNFAAERELCRELGIKAMPTFQIYAEGQKIEDFSCGPKRFGELLLPKLEDIRRGYCEIPEEE